MRSKDRPSADLLWLESDCGMTDEELKKWQKIVPGPARFECTFNGIQARLSRPHEFSGWCLTYEPYYFYRFVGHDIESAKTLSTELMQNPFPMPKDN